MKITNSSINLAIPGCKGCPLQWMGLQCCNNCGRSCCYSWNHVPMDWRHHGRKHRVNGQFFFGLKDGNHKTQTLWVKHAPRKFNNKRPLKIGRKPKRIGIRIVLSEPSMTFRGELLNFRVYMGVSKIGVPQNGWFIMENHIKMDDLGVPQFSETPI